MSDEIMLLDVTVGSTAYHHAAWFWNVGNLAGGNNIFSSADAVYMAEDDSRYTDWVALGNQSTAILSDGELADVFFRAGVSGDTALATNPTDWGILSKDYVAAAVVPYAGVRITSTALPYLNATYELTGSARDAFLGVLNYVNTYGGFPVSAPQTRDTVPDPTAQPVQPTFTWVTRGTSITFLNINDFKAVAKATADYLAAWNSWAWQGGVQTAWGVWAIA